MPSPPVFMHPMFTCKSIAVVIPVFAFAITLGSSLAAAQSTSAAKSDAGDAGARTYKTYCIACHQENGQGVGGAFPPLAGHAPDLLAWAGGRTHLIRVALFGLEGTINVNGTNFTGAMPAWDRLDDKSIAAVLNHVLTAWDNKPRLPAGFKPLAADEVAAVRAESLDAKRVFALRQQIAPAPAAAANNAAPIALSFTEAQAAQGKAAYQHNCMDCHGTTLDNGEFGGAPLRGAYFRNHWGNGSVASLYAYLKTKMPPDRPGALSDKVYADLLAFLLHSNGYESGGRELPTDSQTLQSMSLKRD